MDSEPTKHPGIAERQEKERLALLEVLKEMPIIEIACKRAGIGRATYYRWRGESKKFREAAEQAIKLGVDRINDMSESKLIAMIGKEKMGAISMWLKNNHPRYKAQNKLDAPQVQKPETAQWEDLKNQPELEEKKKVLANEYEEKLKLLIIESIRSKKKRHEI